MLMPSVVRKLLCIGYSLPSPSWPLPRAKERARHVQRSVAGPRLATARLGQARRRAHRDHAPPSAEPQRHVETTVLSSACPAPPASVALAVSLIRRIAPESD